MPLEASTEALTPRNPRPCVPASPSQHFTPICGELLTCPIIYLFSGSFQLQFRPINIPSLIVNYTPALTTYFYSYPTTYVPP